MNLRAQLRVHQEDNSLSSYFQTQAADTGFTGMPAQGAQAAPVLSVVRDAAPPM